MNASPLDTTHFEWAATEDLIRWQKEKTTASGRTRFSPDPESAMFGIWAYVVVLLIAAIAWPLSLLFGWGWWIAAAVIAVVPVVFAVLFTIGYIAEYLHDIKSVRNLEKEIARRNEASTSVG